MNWGKKRKKIKKTWEWIHTQENIVRNRIEIREKWDRTKTVK